MVGGATDTDKSGRPAQLFKIVLIGSENVGKSSLMMRFINGEFGDSYLPTIGVDFATKTFKTEKGDLVKLQAWDTAGQERFRTVTTSYYRGSRAVILVYDVTREETFQALTSWLDITKQNSLDDTIIIVVGNKADGNDANRKVSEESGRQFAEENNLRYFETSARDNINVNKVFEELSQMLVEKCRNDEGKSMSTAPGPLDATMKGPYAKKGRFNGKSKTCLIL